MTVFGAAAFGALLAGAGPQVPTMLDRPSCLDTVMRAVASDRAVAGTYNCFDSNLQMGLQSVGIDSDSAFPTTPHDKFKGVVVALGLPETSADMRGGKLGAALTVRRDLRAAWAEISGKTQNAESKLYTFYVGADGKITAVK
ncbi:MAG: hypothetical protein E6J08_05480 [Chloroflexi bacterium]|nr:MAG: hypothetical protein E6J08_05480 [Chloroflexota bacterium]